MLQYRLALVHAAATVIAADRAMDHGGRKEQPGHRLKQLRLRLELTLRDVEALSRRQVSGCGVAFPPRSLSAPMRLPRTYPAWI